MAVLSQILLLLLLLDITKAFTATVLSSSYPSSNPRIRGEAPRKKMINRHFFNNDMKNNEGIMESSDDDVSRTKLMAPKLSTPYSSSASSLPSTMKRRDVLELSSTASILSMLLIGSIVDPKLAFAESATETVVANSEATPTADAVATTRSIVEAGIGEDAAHPIVILGAGGKLGKICLEKLARQGSYVKGVTRSGRDILNVPQQPSSSKPNDDASSTSSTSTPTNLVTYGAGDVTKYEQLKSTIEGASAVIFAATASGKKKGGDPAHVDYLGLYNTAKACIECEVPKLAVISSGTVTRPDSIGFKATNLFIKYAYGEKIMDYKAAGEGAVRDLYTANPNKNLTYTIIRPGGLIDKPAIGSEQIHISQGDVYSSEVPREDVANIVIESILDSNKGGGDTKSKTAFTTFEINSITGLEKTEGNLPEIPQRVIHDGSKSYTTLLANLLTDDEIKNYYPDLINDKFRGNDILSIDEILKR